MPCSTGNLKNQTLIKIKVHSNLIKWAYDLSGIILYHNKDRIQGYQPSVVSGFFVA